MVRGARAASRSVAFSKQCLWLARSGYRAIFCRPCYIFIVSRAFALLVITYIATEVSSSTMLDLKLEIPFKVVTYHAPSTERTSFERLRMHFGLNA